MAKAIIWNMTAAPLYVQFGNYSWNGSRYVWINGLGIEIAPFSTGSHDNLTSYLKFTINEKYSCDMIGWGETYNFVYQRDALSAPYSLWQTKPAEIREASIHNFRKSSDAFSFYVDSDIHYFRPSDPTQRASYTQQNADKLSNRNSILADFATDTSAQGLLLCGDYMAHGEDEDVYDLFHDDYYKRVTKAGLPTFLLVGNHDVDTGLPIPKAIDLSGRTLSVERPAMYGGIAWNNGHPLGGYYSTFEIHGVRFFGLGIHANSVGIVPHIADWLKSDLETWFNKKTPIVLFQHYNFTGLYSDFWTSDEKDYLRDVIDGYNIQAIFCGHQHRTLQHTWEGHPVYQIGGDRYAKATVRAGQVSVQFVRP